MVERWHRRLKDALRARAAGADWAFHLPWVLLALRSSPHEDSGTSPAESVYGAQLVLPSQFLDAPEPPHGPFLEDLKAHVDATASSSPSHHTSPHALPPAALPDALLSARMVLVRNDSAKAPLGQLYSGPYVVLSRSLHTFTVQIGERVETISTHRLKPAFVEEGVLPAQPPRRGRPPRPVPPPPRPSQNRSPVPATLAVEPAPRRRGRPPSAAPRRVSFRLVPDTVPGGPHPATPAAGRPIRRRRRPDFYY
jgi:hypothetical protein